MKRHLFIFSVLMTTMISVHSLDVVLEKTKDSATIPIPMTETTSDSDAVKTSEPMMDDSVPVLSQPESMMSTVPMMTEVVMPTETKTNDPVTTSAGAPSEQIVTETMTSPEMVMAEETMTKPVITENVKKNEATIPEVSGRSSSMPVTATDVLKKIYDECVQHGSFACVKPKVLSFLSYAAKKDKIMLTDDLTIEKTGRFMNEAYEYEKPQQWGDSSYMRADVLLEEVDTYLANHELKLRVPKEIVSGELLPYVPKFLLQNIPAEIRVPLSNSKTVGQERGIIKKVVMPFLLGLKFKATALIPLALALIALKTWKALTLGLLSIVLSGAMVIFKFTSKPKVVNYEVYHYPAATPVVEHPAPAYDHHGWGRSYDAQPLAYRAYVEA